MRSVLNIKKYIDLQCNGDTTIYSELPEIKYIDYYIRDLEPDSVLDIGSGIGRVSVYFFKKYGWINTKFNLLDGNYGDKQICGIRNEHGEFYNSFEMAKVFCKSNGLININLLDANNNAWEKYNFKKLSFVYSFLSIGFHWPLDFYLDKIYPLLSLGAIVIFGMRGIEKKEWVYKQIIDIDDKKYEILKFVHVPTINRESVLILRKR